MVDFTRGGNSKNVRPGLIRQSRMACKLLVEFKKEYQKDLLHSLAEYKQNVMKTLNLKASRKE